MRRRYIPALILAALSMVATMLLPVTPARADEDQYVRRPAALELSRISGWDAELRGEMSGPMWDPVPDSFSWRWEWSVDGVQWEEVSTEWGPHRRYLRVADVSNYGKLFRAKVTAHRAGFEDVTLTSDALPTLGMEFGTPLGGFPTVSTERTGILGQLEPNKAAVVRPGETLTGTTNVSEEAEMVRSVDVKWQRSVVADGSVTWVDIPGADQLTYTATADDAGQWLRFVVDVVGSYRPNDVTTYTNRATVQTWYAVGPASFTAQDPTIGGDPVVEDTLTADLGEWDPVPDAEEIQYRWLRGEEKTLVGEGPQYTVTPDDVGEEVVVEVTVQRAHWDPVVKTSLPVECRAATFTRVPAVDVQPFIPMVGVESEFSESTSGTWGYWSREPERREYQWYADGEPISGATGTTFTPGPDQHLKALTAAVTGYRAGYEPRTVAAKSYSKVLRPFTYVKQPVVTGEFAVGGVISNSLDIDGFEPVPAVISQWQWLRDGEALPNAFFQSYRLAAADEGHDIQVRVEVYNIQKGYAGEWLTSAPIRIGDSAFQNPQSPVVSGTPAIGEALTTDAGAWPEGTALSYQWVRHVGDSYAPGGDIDGATDATYTPTPDDAGFTLTVRVTATKEGFAATSVESDPTEPILGAWVQTSNPTITGDPVFDKKLSVDLGSWDPALAKEDITYAWYRNGVQTGWHRDYTVVNSDIGKNLHVEVTVNKPGYPVATKKSTAVVPVSAEFSEVPSIEIEGDLIAGGSVRAVEVGQWSPAPDSRSFEWFADGESIGVTGETLELGVDLLGKEISVKVSAARKGYSSRTVESAARGPALAKFVDPPIPTVKGDLKVGATLTATAHPDRWAPVKPEQYHFEWLYDGQVVGTDQAHRLLPDATRAQKIEVRVTGKRADYVDAVVYSMPFAVGSETFVDPPTPRISGTHRVGQELTAVPGGWPAQTRHYFQWTADGVPIAGATEPTYVVDARFLDAEIGVVVIGMMEGYSSASVASGKVPKTGLPVSTRLYEDSRYGTAAAVSRDAFKEPSEVTTVVVATGQDFPDSLSAAPLAAKVGGPLLLVRPDSIPEETVAELTRLGPERIYVVGGDGVVSDSVAKSLEAYASAPEGKVKRLAGSSRILTSIAVAEEGWGADAASAFFATGWDFPDALAAGAAAAGGIPGEGKAFPVILVSGGLDSIDEPTKARIAALGIEEGFIAGGSGVLSSGVERSINTIVGTPAQRFFGSNRFETSAAVAEEFHTEFGSVYYATGSNFPDALAGSVAAGIQGAPLMLAQQGCVPGVVDATTRAIRPSKTYVLGGDGVLDDNVRNHGVCR